MSTRKVKPKVRDKPAQKRSQKRSAAWLCTGDAYDSLCVSGYTRLSDNPEVCAAMDTIAKLVGSMTIHLMENTDDGDIRIKNGLSRKVDIEPNAYMTRANFVYWIVKTMLQGGNGNAVVLPETKSGYIEQLHPVPPSMVGLLPDGWSYQVMIGGQKYDPGDVLHFVLNPDENQPWRGMGYQVQLSDVVKNLKQATATTKAFMESKWKPSVIVKVDAMTEEFASPEGRKKLLGEYFETNEVGQPWLIPADQFSVHEVRPLSLSDLAIADTVKLDKQTVAAILGVPPFVLGVGEFKREAWNNFIASKLMFYGIILQQEMTRKLLWKEEWYFRFNPRSLYSYDMKDLVGLAMDMRKGGVMSGNEVRDWAGMAPKEGLNELVMLENYIPTARLGDQKKLKGGEE